MEAQKESQALAKIQNELPGLLQNSLLTLKNLKRGLERIDNQWPNLSEGFYRELFESLHDNKVTDEEFVEATKYVRDNFNFPNLYVGDLIKYIKDNRPLPEEMPEHGHAVIDPKREAALEQFRKDLVDGKFDPPEEVEP